MSVGASPPPRATELPLLFSAYEDSFHSYTASLADVDRRLEELAARESAITQRLTEDAQSFSDFTQQMRGQQSVLEDTLCEAHRRQAEVQARMADLARRREELADDTTRQEAFAADDDAMSVEEAYWRQLWLDHRAALMRLTVARHGTAAGSSVRRRLPLPTSAGAESPPIKAASVPRKPPLPSTATRPTREWWAVAAQAVDDGDSGALAAALQACPEVVHCVDGHGSTLLHRACEAQPPSPAVVQWLLHRDVATDAFNDRGLTALHVACLNVQDVAHRTKAALLEAGVPVDQESEFGETAAHLLASHDACLPSLEFVVEHGADVRRTAFVAGRWRTPLAVAEECAGGEAQAVRAYLRAVTRHAVAPL